MSTPDKISKPSGKTKYTSIKMPKALASKVELVLEKHGYRSVSEFTLDATRRRLEQLG